LLRTTLAQASAMRDALERGAREGRARLDDVRLERRRTDALADLGEVVLELIRRGDVPDLEEVPEVADAVTAIEQLEERIDGRDRAAARGRARDRGEPGRDWISPGSRSRFDRGRRPIDDDGTVSSSDGWVPPAPADPAQPSAKVWRPGEIFGRGADRRDDAAPPPDPAPGSETRPIRVESIRPERGDPTPIETASGRGRTGGGGIVFDAPDDDGDEDDLAPYMHPDDVPPRKPDA
jgi:hypothetical protein